MVDTIILEGTPDVIWRYFRVKHITSREYNDVYGEMPYKEVKEFVIKGIITEDRTPSKWDKEGYIAAWATVLITTEGSLDQGDLVYTRDHTFTITNANPIYWGGIIHHYEYELKMLQDKDA